MKYICAKIASSNKSLVTILKDMENETGASPDYTIVRSWISDPDEEEISNLYAHAKEDQADFLAEDMMEISDGKEYKDKLEELEKQFSECEDDDERDLIKMRIHFCHQSAKELANRDRLRVDTRKWVASKMKPKKYGDRVELTGPGGGPIVTAAVELSDDQLAAMIKGDDK